MTTALVPTKQPVNTVALTQMMNAALPELKRIAPKYVNLNRLSSLVIAAHKNPKIAECGALSILDFFKKCCECGTDRIGAGGMWPVPFAGYLTAIPDWRLLIDKAKRAGCITHATAEAVYAKDQFHFERGLDPIMQHVPKMGDRGKCVAVYCIYKLPDGSKDFVVMDWEQDIEPIRKRSKASKDGPWVTDPVEMGKKTVVRRAMKPFEGASPELSAILKQDAEVTGYIDAQVLGDPIPMPQEVPGDTQPGTPAPSEERKPEPPGGGDKPNVVRGMIEEVSKKPTRNKSNRYGVKLAGEWYGTFDEDHGQLAEKAHKEETLVEIEWEQDGKYKNLTAIRLAPKEERKPEPSGGGEQAQPEAVKKPAYDEPLSDTGRLDMLDAIDKLIEMKGKSATDKALKMVGGTRDDWDKMQDSKIRELHHLLSVA